MRVGSVLGVGQNPIGTDLRLGVRPRLPDTVVSAGELFCRCRFCRSGGGLRGVGAHSLDQRGHVGADGVHVLAEFREPVQHVAVVRAEAVSVAVRMAEDRRDPHAVVDDSSVWVDAIELAQVCRDLAGLPISLLEVAPVRQVVLADFELNPVVVAGAFSAGAAAPRAVVPRHGLHGGDGAVRELADPAVEPCITVDVVPVVLIPVGAQKGEHPCAVRRVVVRLDVALQVGVVRSRRMPKDTLDGHRPGALVTGALRLHADQRLVILRVFHGRHPPSRRGHAAAPARPSASSG